MAASPNGILATQWHVLRLYRASRRLAEAGHPKLAATLLLLGKLISGIEIVPGAEIGVGTVFVHGNGIVIGSGTVIGRDCRIFQQVTFGTQDGEQYPVVGDGVVLYPGAKVFGGIRVGDGAVVGANAVVREDVPAGVVVGGIPASVIREATATDRQG